MIFLLSRFTLRHLGREWVRTGLAAAGVALGVAVFLAIRIANASVLAAFASTVDAIAGRANLEVTAWSPGMDERLFLRILAVRGVTAAAPLVQGVVPLYSAPPPAQGGRHSSQLPSSGSMLILGVDPFRQATFNSTVSGSLYGSGGSPAFLLDPLAVDISASLAAAHHLRVGSPLPIIVGVRRVTLHVDGVLPNDPLARAYGGNVAVMDIAGTQELFGRVGWLDRVTLRVDPQDIARVQAELGRILPSTAKVQRPSSRTATVERMLGAFDLNLEALSLIALFVGVFLIYNTQSAAVVRRRGELGILRSMGVPSSGIFGLVLLEAAIIGILGASLGLAVGYWMAGGLLHSVAETVSALYVQVEANQVHAPRSLMAGVWLIGVAASVVAALIPAAEAAAIEPAAVVRQGAQVRISHLRWRLFGVLAPSLLLLAAALSVISIRARAPWLSFAAAFSILLGFSLLAPLACRLSIGLLARATEHVPGFPLRIGTAFLLASLERTWIVV
ncbi:MAG: ABC transporter permease, partial [Armatimonadota bacterium]|nr:ABC transporter permease [Armatimonadota bacterium]